MNLIKNLFKKDKPSIKEDVLVNKEVEVKKDDHISEEDKIFVEKIERAIKEGKVKIVRNKDGKIRIKYDVCKHGFKNTNFYVSLGRVVIKITKKERFGNSGIISTYRFTGDSSVVDSPFRIKKAKEYYESIFDILKKEEYEELEKQRKEKRQSCIDILDSL